MSRIGNVLDRVLRKAGVEEQMRRTTVLDEWDDVVGEGISRVTRPVRVSESTLFVEVRSSSWLMELNLMRKEILERLNEGRRDARIDRIVFILAERG